MARTIKADPIRTASEAPTTASQAPAARKHLPPGEREERIVDEAALFFAEVGLEGRTRDLAARMGVSQALIYRYFPSKDALIERVYQTVFGDRWNPDWNTLLADTSRPLADRLIEFYCAYAAGFNYVSMRLFMLSGLFNKGLAERYSFRITDLIFRPVIAELRMDAKQPDLTTQAMTRGERELAMVLHGGIAFLGIRKFVYQMPLPENLDDVVALHVHTFLERADRVISAIAPDEGPETLTVRLIR